MESVHLERDRESAARLEASTYVRARGSARREAIVHTSERGSSLDFKLDDILILALLHARISPVLAFSSFASPASIRGNSLNPPRPASRLPARALTLAPRARLYTTIFKRVFTDRQQASR